MKPLNNKGFTLIELLIALIVIGLIVGLLVGLFSNPVKESTVKQAALRITEHMRAFDEATQKYGIDKGSDITALTDLTQNGYLRMIPTPPSQHAGTIYALDGGGSHWGTAINDTWITIGDATHGVADNVCIKLNELNSGVADIGTGINEDGGGNVAIRNIQCYAGAGGTDANLVSMPLYIN